MDSTEHHTETKADGVDALQLDLNALPNEPRVDKAVIRYLSAFGSYLKDKTDRLRVPGAAVMVRKGNEIVHLNCYGYANLETGEKITPATVFDLGSLSKQFTAIAVLSLVYYEKIDINDKISKFFGGFPRYADSITVEQLIHHKSALPDYIEIHVESREAEQDWYDVALKTSDEWYPQMSIRRAKEHTNKDVLQWIASQKLLPRKPNTEFEYSNSGYVVLAELVEQVTKMRFSECLRERVFGALRMDSTYVFDETCAFTKDAPQVLNHARCYNGVKGIGFVPVGYTPLNFICGDGNVHSTILDLAKWDFYLHQLDSVTMYGTTEESQRIAANIFCDLMWKTSQVESRKKVEYGAGWNLLHNKYEDEVVENGQLVTKKYESRAEYHRGEWLGWRSYIARGSRWLVPEEGKDIDPNTWETLGIIVLSNGNQFNPCRIARHISQMYWGELKKDNIMNRFECD